MTRETPIIGSADDAWVDLRVGDTANVIGRIDSVGGGPNGGFVVSFADWSTLSISCFDATPLMPFQRQWSRGSTAPIMKIKVRRTEDGVEVLAAWEVTNGGGVGAVIPLGGGVSDEP